MGSIYSAKTLSPGACTDESGHLVEPLACGNTEPTRELDPFNDLAPTQQAKANKAWLATSLFAVAALLGMLVALGWGLNKGLDLYDEGFYLLSSTAPGSYPHPSAFAFFMTKLPKLLPDPILNFRLAAIVAQIFSALGLSGAFTIWRRSNNTLKINRFASFAIVLTTLISNLLFPSVYALTIGYNEITNFLTLSAVSFFLLSLSRQSSPNSSAQTGDSQFNQRSNGSWAAFVVASGACLGLAFFAKFSSCLAVYTLMLVTAGFTLTRARTQFFLLLLIGIAIGCGSFFLLIENFSSWWQMFHMTLFDTELSAGGSHSPLRILTNTAISGLWHSRELALLVIAAIALPFAVRKSNSTNFGRQILSMPTLATSVTFAFWIYSSYQRCRIHSSIVYIPLIFIGFAAASCALMTRFKSVALSEAEKRTTLIILGFLAALPFATSFGTDSSIPWHAIGNIAPLFLAAGYLSILIGAELRWVRFAPVCISSMIIVACIQFVSGYLLHYKDDAPLFAQTVHLNAPVRVKNLGLEPHLANLIEQGNSILLSHEFKQGDPILALYDLPGFIYAVGGKSPGVAQYGESETFTTWNDYYLQHLPQKQWKRLYLVVSNSASAASPDLHTVQILSQSGLHFPSDFKLIGTVKRPCPNWDDTSDTYFYKLKTATADNLAAH